MPEIYKKQAQRRAAMETAARIPITHLLYPVDSAILGQKFQIYHYCFDELGKETFTNL